MVNSSMNSTTSTKETPIIPPEDSRMSVNGDDLIDMKLHAAQEILAEVFGISVNEAEEMIRQRSREKMLWPAGFSVDDK